DEKYSTRSRITLIARSFSADRAGDRYTRSNMKSRSSFMTSRSSGSMVTVPSRAEVSITDVIIELIHSRAVAPNRVRTRVGFSWSSVPLTSRAYVSITDVMNELNHSRGVALKRVSTRVGKSWYTCTPARSAWATTWVR